MKTKTLWIPALLLAAGLAQAQNASQDTNQGGRGKGPRQSAEERFKQLDANGDGKVSLQEYLAAKPPGGGNGPGGNATAEDRTARFRKMDTNGDGYLTLDEYKAGRAQMRPPGARDGQRPPGGNSGS